MRRRPEKTSASLTPLGGLGHGLGTLETESLILGLVFLKCVNDKQSEPVKPGERRVELPPYASWRRIEAAAGRPNLGRIIDLALESLERANPALAGVFPKNYNRPEIDQHALGQAVKMIGAQVQHRVEPPPRLKQAPVGEAESSEVRRSVLMLALDEQTHEARRLVELLSFFPGPRTHLG
jgi:hypothetical protein